MATPYYDRLVQTMMEGQEIAQLEYDIQNAPPAMREIATKLFNVVTTLTYHVVALTEELQRLNVVQKYQAPRQPARSAAPQPTQLTSFPAPPSLSLPRLASPSAVSGASPGDVVPCDVAQVVITPQGTRVIPPSGSNVAPVSLPPNVAVNLAPVQSRLVPPPAPDGVTQVVLPPGGALPAEVQAALAARQGSSPETTTR